MTAPGCMAALTPLATGATVSPEAVLFESLGTVLVLGDDASVGEVAEIVARNHRTVVFAPGIEARAFASHVTTVGRKVTAVQGHLGAFQAQVRSASGVSDIGAASPNPNRFFDMVLDLCRRPLWTSELAPLGYFAPGEGAKEQAAAFEAMLALVGKFTKPRYLSYQTDLCAHGVSGFQGCTRCLDVCSAQAIASAGNTVRIDPYLCQGCATCTLACPTGALSFKFPTRDALGRRLEQTLSNPDTAKTVLIVHSSQFAASVQATIAQQGVLSLVVDPLPAFGDELWLRALALGAGTLVLVADELLSPKSRSVIESRVLQMHAALPTLGLARDRLVWLQERDLARWLDEYGAEPLGARGQNELESASNGRRPVSRPSASPSWARYKRLAWIDDVRLLGASVGAETTAVLPAGSSFGQVRVNAQRCTLCFACVNLCPTSALKAVDAKTQQLVFQESACVQCGLCVVGCPEKALSLQARFAPQALANMTRIVLHQDEQLACTSCGTPFVSRRLLASSLARLKDHPVMAKGGREALMTCPSCRQREMLSPS
ncbi:4Fe-4S binding protein [Rhodoferax ferrireducens]|uniref:4Fe-4S binding protein n=1 Tax=Rhodoferax ferrireducens TaxID=192843 RepID=UPI00298E5952|nr:4Fe-4S dicluster domain-containing protein [Rhodoferax ferrireducens]WPC65887.1 4Fe-4S binding protein [Rhodoferax ferrireducens]